MKERLIIQASVDVAATVRLGYHELAALDALAGYGTDAFLKTFYAHMGESYLKPHEAGLRSLFEMVRNEVPGIKLRTELASEAFTKKMPKTGEPRP